MQNYLIALGCLALACGGVGLLKMWRPPAGDWWDEPNVKVRILDKKTGQWVDL